ncbi:MAG: hypothetical protein ACLGI6_18915 [Gammaproteobacteria bacterium]
MTPTTLVLLMLAPVLVWRVYLRVKGMMVSQRSILSRHYTGVLVFFSMVLVAASETLKKPAILTVLLASTAVGIGWGVYGLRKTRFNNQTEFYTPPANLGMVIAMLFFARVMQIGFDLYMNNGSSPTPAFTDSPVTMAAVGLLGGYFGTYSAGLVRWRHALRRQILRG